MNRAIRRKCYGGKHLGIPIPKSQLEQQIGLQYVNEQIDEQGTSEPVLNIDDFAEYMRKRIVNNGNGKQTSN